VVSAVAIAIGIGIAIANNGGIKPDQSLQDVQDLENIEEKPGVKDSVQKQLGLIDESGREMFTPPPSVKSQLDLP